MKKRWLTLVSVFAIGITLLLWVVLPYFSFRYSIYSSNVTFAYRNYVLFSASTDVANLRDLIPSRISLREDRPAEVIFEIGLLHVEIDGKSYECVSLSVEFSLPRSTVPVQPTFDASVYRYLLGLFTNNSELGEVLHRYGFPHTYVQVIYEVTNVGAVNRTFMTMSYPNGSLLVEISCTTPREAVPWNWQSQVWCNENYLRNGNLSAYHWMWGLVPTYLQSGELNLTTTEGTVIWRSLGRSEYALNVLIWNAFPFCQKNGKIGWMEWR